RGARIRKLVRMHSAPPRAAAARPRGVRATLAAALAALYRPLRRVGHCKRLERTVETAGVPVSAATLIAGGLALALLVSIFAAIAGASGLVILLLFLIGAVTPVVAVRWLASRR